MLQLKQNIKHGALYSSTIHISLYYIEFLNSQISVVNLSKYFQSCSLSQIQNGILLTMNKLCAASRSLSLNQYWINIEKLGYTGFISNCKNLCKVILISRWLYRGLWLLNYKYMIFIKCTSKQIFRALRQRPNYILAIRLGSTIVSKVYRLYMKWSSV